MNTEPRTEAGRRLMARAPKANMAKVRAYEASEKAQVDTWLTFEADYWQTERERAELGADW